VKVSLRGFRDKYKLHDEIQFVDHSTRELQEQLTPSKVLQLLQEGNERFRSGRRLDRNLNGRLGPHAASQHPLAVILSGVHASTPAELIFDMGLGDIFSVRIAANIAGPKVMGSIEYGCAVAGAKLILVMGNTGSAMIRMAIELAISGRNPEEATGCQHLDVIISEIQRSIDLSMLTERRQPAAKRDPALVDEIARQNVLHTVRKIADQSRTIRAMIDDGRVAIVGAMYDVTTGEIDYLLDDAVGLQSSARVCSAEPLSFPSP
jgi:carbonic anhydrase/SulP family sulfate permease